MMKRLAVMTLVTIASMKAATSAGAQPVAGSTCGDRSVPSVGGVMTGAVASVRHLPSRDSLLWLGAGGVAALAAHPADRDLTRRWSTNGRLDTILSPGAVIGSGAVQLGAGASTYAIGALSRHPCVATLGADLLRAQLVADGLTFAVQYAVRRKRPDNGSGFSFPSGHASVTFASAAVLQERLGWKAGVPAYAVATYVAASRIQARRHNLSDVVFGAAVGIVSAHTTTFGQRHRFAMVPAAAPGGAALMVVRVP